MLTIENPLQKPLVFDTSYWNGKLTAEQLLSTKCEMIITRTGISWGYQDPLFHYYQDLAESIGIPHCGYHVIYPSQEASYQVENVKIIIDDKPGSCKVPIWIDLELNQNMQAGRIAEVVQEFGELLQKEYGGEKGIYSRTSWINYYMPYQTWLDGYWWWLAQYLYSGTEHPGPYSVPVGVSNSRVLQIQTTQKGKIEGHQGDVDFNRFVAGAEKLEWFTAEIEPPLTFGQRLKRMEDAVDKLNKEVFG